MILFFTPSKQPSQPLCNDNRTIRVTQLSINNKVSLINTPVGKTLLMMILQKTCSLILKMSVTKIVSPLKLSINSIDEKFSLDKDDGIPGFGLRFLSFRETLAPRSS